MRAQDALEAGEHVAHLIGRRFVHESDHRREAEAVASRERLEPHVRQIARSAA